jgi:hypothetical protein
LNWIVDNTTKAPPVQVDSTAIQQRPPVQVDSTAIQQRQSEMEVAETNISDKPVRNRLAKKKEKNCKAFPCNSGEGSGINSCIGCIARDVGEE